MPLFDAHCDTVIKVLDDPADFSRGAPELHIDFPRLVDANVRAQLFAVFVLAERHPGAASERAGRLLTMLEEMTESTGGRMRIARTRIGLESAFSNGPLAAIVGLEGADPLEGRAETLRSYVERGVRSLIFAWKDNEFSGTAFGTDKPLTREGRRLLGLCEELDVMVDVSHLSDRAFNEVCELANRPFIASHSNSRALCPHPRNLTDEMIRSLADHGGVMGINLSPRFLDPESDRRWRTIEAEYEREALDWRARDRRVKQDAARVPRPPMERIVEHVLHAINVGGEDIVGLGGDLDGISQLPEGIEGVQHYPRIAEALQGVGLSKAQIRKVCFGNFLRVFSEVLPDRP